MVVIAEIVRNLLVIIIISTILEMMLPEGNTRPFVRFAVGMFVLIAILTPSLDYLYEDGNFQISAWDDRVYGSNAEKINSSSERIQKQITDRSNSLMQEKVEGQIGAIALLVPGVEDVETAVIIGDNGNPKKISLIVRSSQAAESGRIQPVEAWGRSAENSVSDQITISNKVKRLITNLYGLEQEDIDVKFEGS